MSGSRRIPISSTRAPPGSARPTTTRQQQPHHPAAPFPSSLDLVFSFFRSAPLASLPSSPSFVARYRRPGHPDDDREADDASLAGTSSLAPSEAETDYDEGWSEGDDEVGPEEVNSWDPAVGADEPAWTRERVPRNAVRKASAGRRVGQAREPSAESDPASQVGDERGQEGDWLRPPGLAEAPTERTGLLAGGGGGGARERALSLAGQARAEGADGEVGRGRGGGGTWGGALGRMCKGALCCAGPRPGKARSGEGLKPPPHPTTAS